MAGKKVLIVYAHQEPRSFNGALKDVAVAELIQQGCSVTVSDLYALNFEPRATGKDITGLRCMAFLAPPATWFLCSQRNQGLLPPLHLSGVTLCCLWVYLKHAPAPSACLMHPTASHFSLFTPNAYLEQPSMHGTLHFCGFKVLAPQISFGPETTSEEERERMVAAWAQRLKTLWEEEPIDCSPSWYFGQ
ncbi:hypothetical protein FD754_009596 [Muntiacus muntjak]|uniref:Flavodoxin-like fold domain-containing protein n=1 Tax=Muntiacus muntjak TaxID=9888 RepID=A0A5N3WUE2_MUNMU|nr:hypothetical protein FD754_009596 [Muntiacus muntjak]